MTPSSKKFSHIASATLSARGRPWIVCQIGAREHYAVGRALHQEGLLQMLMTDRWVTPGSIFSRIPGTLGSRLEGRFVSALSDANVIGFNAESIAVDAINSSRGRSGSWAEILERNAWFQRRVVEALRKSRAVGPYTLFCYSYAARAVFEYGKSLGWTCVLGQIDPGFYEEELVADLHSSTLRRQPGWERAPTEYWRCWRDECRLADRIIVNSTWSRAALKAQDVPDYKLVEVPLEYTVPEEARTFKRCPPSEFSKERPLRVLFLGQINLRKGIDPLLSAAKILAGVPIMFTIVGPLQVELTENERNASNIVWAGSVPRTGIDRYYRDTDLFILPTFSDGFAITQKEAEAWLLPIVATDRCGRVVEHGANGLIIDPGNVDSIVEALHKFVRHPELYATMVQNVIRRTNRNRDRRLVDSLLAGVTGTP